MFRSCLPIFLLLFSITSFADFRQANRLYADKNYEAAFPIFLRMAEIGHPYSRFNLGVMYYNGLHVEQNHTLGYAWMKLAEDRHATIAEQVAAVYGGFTEEGRALADLEFAKLQSRFGADILAKSLYPSPRADEDCPPLAKPTLKKQPKYPQKALQRGEIGGVVVVFDVDEEGRVLNPEVVAGQQIFRDEALRAVAEFRYEPNRPEAGVVNRLLFNIQGSNPEAIKKQINELKEKADNGDAAYQYIYAASALVTAKRPPLATINEYLVESSVAGVPQAQYLLATNLLGGRGCDVDREKALAWLQKSASRDYAPAQFLIAKELENENAAASRLWLENAADSEHAPAMVKLAWTLATSEIEPDPAKSLRLAKQAEKKYADKITAWYTLAAAYAANGEYKKAVKYQKKAIKRAKKRDWNLTQLEAQLASYNEQKQPWS